MMVKCRLYELAKYLKSLYVRRLTNKNCGAKQNLMTDNQHLFDVDLERFEAQVIHASDAHPILVDLWAEWCPPCVVIAPILAQIAKERTGKIAIAKVEVDEGENMKIAGRYQVRGFPTVLLIYRGKECGRFSGAKNKSFIDQFIDEALVDAG